MNLGSPVIGLVGGIGSGKSAVAAAWKSLGCTVAHSDDLAKRALEDPTIRDTLIGWWGATVLDTAGRVDRSAVAKIVFTDGSQRKRLEELVHPWIEQLRRAAFAASPKDVPALVIDAPLLLEAGLDRECDAVVFVDAPLSERIRRVQSNRGWDTTELSRREAAQWSLDRKRAAAHHVISNEGDLSSLQAEASRVLEAIRAEFRRKRAASVR